MGFTLTFWYTYILCIKAPILFSALSHHPSLSPFHNPLCPSALGYFDLCTSTCKRKHALLDFVSGLFGSTRCTLIPCIFLQITGFSSLLQVNEISVCRYFCFILSFVDGSLGWFYILYIVNSIKINMNKHQLFFNVDSLILDIHIRLE